MTMHPITDAVLTAQREALKARTSINTPMAVQRQVAREVMYHAMHTLAMLDPHVSMQDIAGLCREAIISGVKLGQQMGNNKL